MLTPKTTLQPTSAPDAMCNVLRDTFPAAHAAEDPRPTVISTKTPHRECNVLRDTSAQRASTVLELRVRNHPGTMSHITGLFARRGFNLDAIVCVPIDDGATSRMLLLVADDARLEQVERQLAKLHDVLDLRHRTDLDADFFTRLAADA